MRLPDPEQIEGLARRAQGHADEVRERCHEYRATVAQVAWRSAAAEQYRLSCEQVARAAAGNAGGLDEVAAALHAHAAEVRNRIAWMHQMVDQLRQEAEDAWDATQGAFEWGRAQADEAWETVARWV